MSLSQESIGNPFPLSFQWGKAIHLRKGITEKLQVGSSGLTPHKNLQTGSRKEVTGSNKIHIVSLKIPDRTLPLPGIIVRFEVQTESSGEQNAWGKIHFC